MGWDTPVRESGEGPRLTPAPRGTSGRLVRQVLIGQAQTQFGAAAFGLACLLVGMSAGHGGPEGIRGAALGAVTAAGGLACLGIGLRAGLRTIRLLSVGESARARLLSARPAGAVGLGARPFEAYAGRVPAVEPGGGPFWRPWMSAWAAGIAVLVALRWAAWLSGRVDWRVGGRPATAEAAALASALWAAGLLAPALLWRSRKLRPRLTVRFEFDVPGRPGPFEGRAAVALTPALAAGPETTAIYDPSDPSAVILPDGMDPPPRLGPFGDWEAGPGHRDGPAWAVGLGLLGGPALGWVLWRYLTLAG